MITIFQENWGLLMIYSLPKTLFKMESLTLSILAFIALIVTPIYVLTGFARLGYPRYFGKHMAGRDNLRS